MKSIIYAVTCKYNYEFVLTNVRTKNILRLQVWKAYSFNYSG